MKLSKKGQITIPRDVREKLNLKPGDQLEFVNTEKGLVLRRKISEQAFDDLKGIADTPQSHSTEEHLGQTRGNLD